MWLRVKWFHSAIITVLLPFFNFPRLFTRSFASTCIWFIAPTKCGHYRRKQRLKLTNKTIVLTNMSAMFDMSLPIQRLNNKNYAQMFSVVDLLFLNIILQGVRTSTENTVRWFTFETQWNSGKGLKQRRLLTVNYCAANGDILGKESHRRRTGRLKTSIVSRICTSLNCSREVQYFPDLW